MSDYISKSALIDFLKEEIKQYRPDDFKIRNIQRYIEDIPTVDEKEIIRKPFERVLERLEEKTEFLKDCTKYGNKNEKQQEHSYSTMMMYEVADLVDDLIEICKEEGGLNE